MDQKELHDFCNEKLRQQLELLSEWSKTGVLSEDCIANISIAMLQIARYIDLGK